MNLISVREMAKRLAISQKTARRRIHEHKLPSMRIGSLIRIDEAELLKFIERSRLYSGYSEDASSSEK